LNRARVSALFGPKSAPQGSAYPIIPPPYFVTSRATHDRVAKSTKPSSKETSDGELRIIGGQWRGRKLHFPALPGLRPSPDRVRETLFNWLAPEINGAHCLDLFAGSGALGLEALSRGAANCVFVDNARAACDRIGEHLTLLSCREGIVSNSAADHWLRKPSAGTAFDMVFLDPPFRQDILQNCCALLEQHGWLAQRAWIYIEAGADEALPTLPPNWTLHRDKRAGQVAYRLFLRVAALSATS
jgi:16S rRNA (guanine966-N2)-methyltransferase